MCLPLPDERLPSGLSRSHRARLDEHRPLFEHLDYSRVSRSASTGTDQASYPNDS